MFQQKELEGVEKSPLPADSEVWVPGYLTPSWVCLPNEKPVLAVIDPGQTALYTLETVCKVRLVYGRCVNSLGAELSVLIFKIDTTVAGFSLFSISLTLSHLLLPH